MKPTILVVDDDERSLSVLDRVLSIAGYEVLTTVCGTEVECLLETQSPDIVLLDIRMPGIDGLTILGRVKGDRPNLPIVMMSAYVTMTSLDEAIRSGADGFLEKPFDIDDLRSCLAEALDPVAVTGLPGVRSTAEALAALLFEDGWTVLLVQVEHEELVEESARFLASGKARFTGQWGHDEFVLILDSQRAEDEKARIANASLPLLVGAVDSTRISGVEDAPDILAMARQNLSH